MNENSGSNRAGLIRESLVFQLKLIADGTRDFLLVPISLAATIVGLLRGGEDPDREFKRVLDLGRQSDQWINLFGQHDPLSGDSQAGSIDQLLERAEEVVREQASQGGVSDGASNAIRKAIDAVHRKTDQLDKSSDN